MTRIGARKRHLRQDRSLKLGFHWIERCQRRPHSEPKPSAATDRDEAGDRCGRTQGSRPWTRAGRPPFTGSSERRVIADRRSQLDDVIAAQAGRDIKMVGRRTPNTLTRRLPRFDTRRQRPVDAVLPSDYQAMKPSALSTTADAQVCM